MTTPTPFLNIQVTAIPTKDSAGKVTYKTTFLPEKVSVTAHDTVLNYQLVAPTPTGVTFKNVNIVPGSQSQLSIPSISQSGKLVTFSDANTVAENFNLTFYFKDSDGIEFQVDPEVDNFPPPDLDDKK